MALCLMGCLIVALLSAASPSQAANLTSGGPDRLRRRSGPVDDIEVLSDLFSVEFSAAEEECIYRGRFLYESDGRCYKLRTRGPCKGTEWLVYGKEQASGNESSRLRTVCRVRPCRHPYRFISKDQKCHPRGEVYHEICPYFEGLVFRYNNFGEGLCVCRNGTARVSDGSCYPVYGRGPCDEGYVVTPVYDVREYDLAKCEPDPCHEMKAEMRERRLVRFNNFCYSDEEGISCGFQSVITLTRVHLSIWPPYRYPKCTDETTGSDSYLSSLPPQVLPPSHTAGRFSVSSDCVQDASGMCVKRVTSFQKNRQFNGYTKRTRGRR